MSDPREQDAWQVVCDVKGGRVRRFAVPGGWLYQVELENFQHTEQADHPDYDHFGWHPPVFVPKDGMR